MKIYSEVGEGTSIRMYFLATVATNSRLRRALMSLSQRVKRSRRSLSSRTIPICGRMSLMSCAN